MSNLSAFEVFFLQPTAITLFKDVFSPLDLTILRLCSSTLSSGFKPKKQPSKKFPTFMMACFKGHIRLAYWAKKNINANTIAEEPLDNECFVANAYSEEDFQFQLKILDEFKILNRNQSQRDAIRGLLFLGAQYNNIRLFDEYSKVDFFKFSEHDYFLFAFEASKYNHLSTIDWCFKHTTLFGDQDYVMKIIKANCDGQFKILQPVDEKERVDILKYLITKIKDPELQKIAFYYVATSEFSQTKSSVLDILEWGLNSKLFDKSFHFSQIYSLQVLKFLHKNGFDLTSSIDWCRSDSPLSFDFEAQKWIFQNGFEYSPKILKYWIKQDRADVLQWFKDQNFKCPFKIITSLSISRPNTFKWILVNGYDFCDTSSIEETRVFLDKEKEKMCGLFRDLYVHLNLKNLQ